MWYENTNKQILKQKYERLTPLEKIEIGNILEQDVELILNHIGAIPMSEAKMAAIPTSELKCIISTTVSSVAGNDTTDIAENKKESPLIALDEITPEPVVGSAMDLVIESGSGTTTVPVPENAEKKERKKRAPSKPRVVTSKKKETSRDPNAVECQICIEWVSKEMIFKCNACSFEYCVECGRTHLLGSSQDAHCMNCRAAIPFDVFVRVFNKTWVFGKYKKHRQEVLFNRQKAMIPKAMEYIDGMREIKEIEQDQERIRTKLIKMIEARSVKIRNIKIRIARITDPNAQELQSTTKSENKNNFVLPCPRENCKAFLNKKMDCPVCNAHVCKDCFAIMTPEEIEAEKSEAVAPPVIGGTGAMDVVESLTLIVDNPMGTPGDAAPVSKKHVCDPSVKETYQHIRKEAKPCPACGEFISKISGCDQMFCVNESCGTAFSWKTGEIEKGIIHNPHASEFFNRNREKLDAYTNRVRGNGCRDQLDATVVDRLTRSISDKLKAFGVKLDDIPDQMTWKFITYNTHETHIKYSSRSPACDCHSCKVWAVDSTTKQRYATLYYLTRYINEFNGYHRTTLRHMADGNIDEPERRKEMLMDVVKYVRNELIDEDFKKMLAKNEKRFMYNKEMAKLTLSTYQIAEILATNAFEIAHAIQEEIVKSNSRDLNYTRLKEVGEQIQLLSELDQDYQKKMKEIQSEFNYSSGHIQSIFGPFVMEKLKR
jgi:hypothetical protein